MDGSIDRFSCVPWVVGALDESNYITTGIAAHSAETLGHKLWMIVYAMGLGWRDLFLGPSVLLSQTGGGIASRSGFLRASRKT